MIEYERWKCKIEVWDIKKKTETYAALLPNTSAAVKIANYTRRLGYRVELEKKSGDHLRMIKVQRK